MRHLLTAILDTTIQTASYVVNTSHVVINCLGAVLLKSTTRTATARATAETTTTRRK